MNNNSYQDELDRYFQVVHNKEVPERILYKANLSKVRTKLKHKAFIELNDHMTRFFYESFNPQTWFGFNLLAVLRAPRCDDLIKSCLNEGSNPICIAEYVYVSMFARTFVPVEMKQNTDIANWL